MHPFIMDDQVFFERLSTELKKIAEDREYKLQPGKAFGFWLGKNYFHLEDEDEIETRLSDGFGDEGIDGVFVDEEECVINFINTTTVREFEKTRGNLPETDVKTFLSGFELIVFGSYKGKVNPILEQLANEYHQLLARINYKTKLVMFHLLNKPVSRKYATLFTTQHPEIEIEFFDFAEMKKIYEAYLFYREPPPEQVPIEVVGSILRSPTDPRAIIFTINGKTLANLFFTYGTRLFQRNIRYYLTPRAKSINSQIQETASSIDESKLFWYYNNGVTIVCKKFHIAGNEKVVSLDGMQIINGAQTTYSLFEASNKNKLNEDVKVLLKVVESTEEEFIDNVTLFTNSQNPVNLRDLCSKDTIQTRIQTALLGARKYFYERKRGEFNALYPTPEMKKGILGPDWKDKIINNERAAQAILSFSLDKPAQAKSSKKRIFVKGADGFYDEIFCDCLVEEALLMNYKLLLYIQEKIAEYREIYDQASTMDDELRAKIYSFDFLLYTDLFILNLFRDFLECKPMKFDSAGSLEIIDLLQKKDPEIETIFYTIVLLLQEYILKRKAEDATYLHMKLIKSEASLSLIRDFLHNQKELSLIRLL